MKKHFAHLYNCIINMQVIEAKEWVKSICWCETRIHRYWNLHVMPNGMGRLMIMVADELAPNIHKVMISNHHAESPANMVLYKSYYAIKYMQEVQTFAKETQLIDGQLNRYCVTWYLYRSILGCVVVVLSLQRGTTIALTFTSIYDSCAFDHRKLLGFL